MERFSVKTAMANKWHDELKKESCLRVQIVPSTFQKSEAVNACRFPEWQLDWTVTNRKDLW